jgi:hypothetical protein
MQHHVEGVRWAMSSNWKVVISKRRGDCHRASLARPPIDAALNMNAFWLAQDTCLEGAEGLDTTPGIAVAGAAGTLGTELTGTDAPGVGATVLGKPGTAEPAGGATGAVCEKFCMMPVSCPLVPRFVT